MKKTLLSLAAIASTIFTGMANEYTFVFDGNNDIGGLTRQTSTKADELTFSESVSIVEEGIELSVTNAAETGKGFALVNAGGTNAGILVFASMASNTSMKPQISMTVPNGKITAAKLYMSGTGLITLDVDFNGKAIESENEGALYSWSWKDSEGIESLTMGWENNFSSRYIHKIELTYSPDLGGKQECGLSFSADTYEAILGESFSSPYLRNPNKLAISWSSSDENVATVDADGKITLIGRGKTTIAASTEGNEEFAAGNAKYELEVIPSASNIAELLKDAPEVYDRVKVNFPATVTFGNGSIAFVVDSEGNAACFDDMRNRNSTSTTVTTIYKVGDVIPAGWIATNATIYESVIWEGLPEKSTETVEVVYPKVNSVTPADADRVVILKNVTFTTNTAVEFTKAYGTTPDGTRYEFQDTYNVASKPAGTYDVTCVVRYSKRGTTEYFYLAPIAYSEPSGDTVELPTFPESFNVTVDNSDVNIWQGGVDEINGSSLAELSEEELEFAQQFQAQKAIVFSGNVTAESVTATFNLPEGWEGVMPLRFKGMSVEDTYSTTRANESEWAPLEEYKESFKYMGRFDTSMECGKQLVFPVDNEKQIYFCYLYIYDDGTLAGGPEYAGDYVDIANMFMVVFDVKNEGLGVEAIDSTNAAIYYDLQGNRISEPATGVYVKVANGKASKVIVK